MSSTPNLLISHIASNQASKEVTANSAFDLLDLAMTNEFVKVIGDSDYALADPTEARQNLVFVFTGVVTADRHVFLPPTKKLYIVSNQTEAGSPLAASPYNLIFEIEGSSSPFFAGTTVAVPNLGSTSPFVASDYVILYADGTNVIPLTALPLDEGIWVPVPAHNTSNGIAGQVAYDGSYLYVCTATNNWARVAIGGTW